MYFELCEINQIITLCDEMIKEIKSQGILRTGNKTYVQKED